MTREEKLQKAHQMFDNRNLLIELKWQKEYFKRGYVSSQEELFNLWIFDECIKALEQEPVLDKIKSIVAKWKMDTWTDSLSYECMAKIAELVQPQESEGKGGLDGTT